MSLILDALRKSDGQRQRKAAERLREGPRPARSEDNSGWWLLAALFLLLLAGMAAFLLLRGLPHGQDVNRETPATPAEPGTTAKAEIRSLNAELVRRRLEPVQRIEAPAVPEAAQAETAPVHDTSSTADDHLDAPLLQSLPDDVRSTLPALHVDVHAWAEVPSERFVLINLRRYQEGERLEEGPVLRQIQPEAVVLEYRGRLFSLPRR